MKPCCWEFFMFTSPSLAGGRGGSEGHRAEPGCCSQQGMPISLWDTSTLGGAYWILQNGQEWPRVLGSKTNSQGSVRLRLAPVSPSGPRDVVGLGFEGKYFRHAEVVLCAGNAQQRTGKVPSRIAWRYEEHRDLTDRHPSHTASLRKLGRLGNATPLRPRAPTLCSMFPQKRGRAGVRLADGERGPALCHQTRRRPEGGAGRAATPAGGGGRVHAEQGGCR